MKRTVHPSEHAIQVAFIDWVHSVENLPDYEPLRLSFSVPNGARVRWGTANKLKSEGLRKGVPDWMLPYAVGWPPVEIGLAIEFKTKRGTLSDEQKDYMRRLDLANWRVQVCRSTEEAIAVVKEYLGIDNRRAGD